MSHNFDPFSTIFDLSIIIQSDKVYARENLRVVLKEGELQSYGEMNRKFVGAAGGVTSMIPERHAATI